VDRVGRDVIGYFHSVWQPAVSSAIRGRIRAREGGRDPQWYLDIVGYLVGRREETRLEDPLAGKHGRSPADTAARVFRLAG
jgi:hypothetical protein